MKSKKYFMIQKFRPSPLPIEGLPLGLRAVGHFKTPAGLLPPVRYSTYIILAWGLNGILRCNISNVGCLDLSKENMLVIMPGLEYEIESLTDKCEFRFFAVDGPQAQNLILNNGLWTGLFPSRQVPVEWLNMLTELATAEDKSSQILAASRAHDMIVYQAEQVKGLVKDMLVYHAQWYINRVWHNNQLNVESVLSHLNVDRATLSTRFKRHTGQSILEYITMIRINNAKRLLRTTSMPVLEISNLSGFGDPAYFTRLFRKKTGCTPVQYRIGMSGAYHRSYFNKSVKQEQALTGSD